MDSTVTQKYILHHGNGPSTSLTQNNRILGLHLNQKLVRSVSIEFQIKIYQRNMDARQ